MTGVLLEERSHDATRFTSRSEVTKGVTEATAFSKPGTIDWDDDPWQAAFAKLRSFYELEDDWDGNGSVAPESELIDGAIRLAFNLMRANNPSPHRVIAGVNGTIAFEYHDESIMEIEVMATDEAHVYEGGQLLTKITF